MLKRVVKSWLKDKKPARKRGKRFSFKQNLNNYPLSNGALTIIKKLNDAGFEAYIVGGWVRDTLITAKQQALSVTNKSAAASENVKAKDIDIATNATPEQIKKVIRNSRIIGRRFKIVHVYFHREIIEVTTFRGDSENIVDKTEHGMLKNDNTYASCIAGDARRRDFTLNSLYYSPRDKIIYDYLGGHHDINKGIIRVIGDPETRFIEDPVRILRAVRIASKLNFNIEKKAAQKINSMHSLLKNIPAARLHEEYIKLFMTGHSENLFEQLLHYDLFQYLFPESNKLVKNNPQLKQLFLLALKSTDSRIKLGKPVTPAFLIAVFLWLPYKNLCDDYAKNNANLQDAEDDAYNDIIYAQNKILLVPRRLDTTITAMWMMQNDLISLNPGKIKHLISHPKFRAAYDFLVLRAESGENLQRAAHWWTDYQSENEKGRQTLLDKLKSPGPKKRLPQTKHAKTR